MCMSESGRGREKARERENPKEFHAVCTKPNAGLHLSNCEIMTRAKKKRV